MAFGIDDAIGAGLQIINKFIPDPAQKQAAEEALRSSLQQWDATQNTVNAAEAGSNSVFVAGWRPAIGWICACALGYQYVLLPIAIWIAALQHSAIPNPPKLDDTLWQLMFGMLGMGGLRTYEKIKGVSK